MAGIYLHIPFCARRCTYCDFYSTTQHEKKTAYAEALCKELERRKEYLHSEPVETIYFGGGTPSQLDEEQLSRVLNTIYKVYAVVPDAEITIECNPDDLTRDYAAMLRRLPFNRLSMGIQTFDESMLRWLRRRHTASQAVEAYRTCREIGFERISIDLMYGLPQETEAQWANDLQRAVALRPEHLSAYHLIYEQGTPLWKLRERCRAEEIPEELSVRLFEMLLDRLGEAGYEHYEISNFCLPGYESQHNSGYWTGEHYLGCGAAAHSFDGISRQWNVASIDAYIKGTEEGGLNFEREALDLCTRYNDYVVTALRTRWGMDLKRLRETFGEALYRYCLEMAEPHIGRQVLAVTDGALHLTRDGLFVSDGIMSDLLWMKV